MDFLGKHFGKLEHVSCEISVGPVGKRWSFQVPPMFVLPEKIREKLILGKPVLTWRFEA